MRPRYTPRWLHAALNAQRQERRPRWDLKKLYHALNQKRQAEGLTWVALAEQLGCTPNQLTGIRTAKFGITMNVAMAITQWLHRPAAHFIFPAEW